MSKREKESIVMISQTLNVSINYEPTAPSTILGSPNMDYNFIYKIYIYVAFGPRRAEKNNHNDLGHSLAKKQV